MKSITGGDTISARFLHREYFEYRPQFTIWLAANHRPTVRDDDPAIWRRLKVAPFEQEIPEDERDPEVKQQLRENPDHQAAILAWAAKGTGKWQREGLREPAAVREATAEYRNEMAIFSQFIEDRCVLSDEQWVATRPFIGEYESWSRGQGHRYPFGPRRITGLLRARGCAPEKRGGIRGWRGIGLAPAQAA